jgi:hypothetical protein
MPRHAGLAALAAVLATLACAPAAGAAATTEGTVTLLKGSTITVTFPDGTSHTQPMGGTFRGTVPSRRRTAPFRIALEVSNAYEAFGPRAVLCGGVRSVGSWRSVFILAEVYSGAPPSWVRVGADGRVTLSWSVYSLNAFTGCRAPLYAGQPDPALQTVTLTGTTTKLGLRRLVLRGGAGQIPTADGPAGFSIKLVTRVDVS